MSILNLIMSIFILYHMWLLNKDKNSRNIKNQHASDICGNDGPLLILQGDDSLEYNSSSRTEMEFIATKIMSKCVANNNEYELMKCLYLRRNHINQCMDLNVKCFYNIFYMRIYV